MAIAKVADRANINGAATVTTVDLVLSGMTIGNTLIIRASADNSGTSGAAQTMTVTNQSGTPINLSTDQQFTQLNDPGTASSGLCVYVVVAEITATSGTVRLTYGGAVMQAAQAEEWSGIDNTAPVVGTPVKANGVGSTTMATVTDTSVASGNMAYVALGFEGPSTYTYTEDSDTTNGSWVSLTKRSSTNATALSNQTIAGAYKIVTATGQQVYNTGLLSTATDSAAIIIEFAAAAAVIAKNVTDTLSISITETDPATVDKTAPIFTEDFEDTSYLWTVNSGDWIRTSAQAHGGTWSLTNLDIGDSGASEIVIAKPAEALSIDFWYRVNSESGWDYFRFIVDGVEIFKASGVVGWTNYTYDVTTATTITFKYTKDSSSSFGEDSAYIDDVTFAGPAGPPPSAVPVSDTASISITDTASVLQGLTQTLNPDAVLTQTNLTGAVTDIDEDPDSPDASWMTGGGAVVLRVSFPTPTTDLVPGFPQEFRIRARPGT